MKKNILLATTVAASLVLASCSGGGEAPSSSAASSTEAADDSLVLAVGPIAESEFDPLKGWGSHNEHKVIHSSLVKWGWNDDHEMELVGDLAESYEQDGTTWTFTLHDDFGFSDGEPITAADVVFTLELLKEDGTNFDLSNIASVQANGDHEVVIELAEPDTLFGPQLATIGIVPEHAYGPDYSENPISSGPYMVTEYHDGEQLMMEANPHYPKPLHYKKLTFLLSDEDTALAAASAGEVDIVKTSYANAERELPGMELHQLPSVETMAITLPTELAGGTATTMGVEGPAGNDVTGDPAVRKALSLAVDRQELTDLVIAGYGDPAFSVADELPWFPEELEFEDGKVDEAKKILEEAGWTDSNGDGTVDKDGVEAVVPLMYTTSDQARVDLAQAFAAQAEEIGISFELEGATWDDIYAKGKSAAVVFALGSLSPKELWDTYSSHSIGVGYNNMPNYSNPEVDKHLEAARSAGNLQDSISDWQQAQIAGASTHPDGDVPMLWLLTRDHLYYVDEGVDIGDQIVHGHGHGLQIFQNITEWK